MNAYDQFQMECYGNILAHSDEGLEHENGELIMQQQGVWFEREEQIANEEIYL
jgi:hypothetical protein